MKSLPVILLALLTCASLSAQSYYESRRTWDKGPLAWNEFKGRVDNDTSIVALRWNWIAEPVRVKVGTRQYWYMKFQPTMDMTESWVRGNFHNDQTLQFCQTAFNLMELCCRQATADYASSPESTGTLDIKRFYQRQYRHRLDQMEVETRRGQNPEQMALYAAGVETELEMTHFDPTSIRFSKGKARMDLAAGYAAQVMLGDACTSMPAGIDVMMGIGWGRRHLATMNFSAVFPGKSKFDIETRNGMIEKDDRVTGLQCLFGYGYQVNQDVERPLYPWIGLGVQGISGPQLQAESDKRKSNDKNGFLMAAGMIYDIPFMRHYILKGCSTGTYYSHFNTLRVTSVRLMPKLQLAHYSDLGWQPSIHLSLTVNWGMVWSE